MIITINRTIVKDDVGSSLSEDERAEYAASKGDLTRTPIKPPRQEFEAQASLVIKSESKTKTPRKKASKQLSTPTTAKKLPPQKSTTVRRQPKKPRSPSASPSPLVRPSDHKEQLSVRMYAYNAAPPW
ncbi:hypothetical protein N7G274_001844 [Stereocaulon virgatum]|uniref:Uncharacterized protein n=1 Tax=Stereocaulon virgatum TaxID=373712 RepID=A0ABR4ANW2_9LECA